MSPMSEISQLAEAAAEANAAGRVAATRKVSGKGRYYDTSH
jgi:hypothetical protein